MNIEDIGVIDLFCGIGGLSHGFVKEKISVLAGIDVDSSCKFAFEKNNKSNFINKSIADVSKNDLLKIYNQKKVKIKVLVGCAPCQPFSSYTFKEKEKDGKKWGLIYEFLRLIKEVKPEIISMENVPQLLNFKKAPVFNDFILGLEKFGYHTSYSIVNCPDYGIPQRRKRLVVFASKFGKIDLIEKTHNPKNYKTVKDTIFKLNKIEDGQFDCKDPIHFARKLSKENKIRIANTPYGGSWLDWDENIRLECHKKSTGKSYSSVYGRMKWEEPSPTITTHCIGFGNGRFGHPEQDRAISLREAALFQTFPMNYKFFEKGQIFSTSKIGKQIGNAVPVDLGRVIAKSIKVHLNSVYEN